MNNGFFLISKFIHFNQNFNYTSLKNIFKQCTYSYYTRNAEIADVSLKSELSYYNHEFNEFLNWQAQALLQNNEDMDMLADKHWAVMQDTPLEFTISRENYEDEIFDN